MEVVAAVVLCAGALGALFAIDAYVTRRRHRHEPTPPVRPWRGDDE